VKFLVTFLFLALSLTARAEDPPFDKMSWLVGDWQGEGLGGTVEEFWSAPAGGSMMGCFRLIQDDTIMFYEFFFLAADSAGTVLKLKHFNPDMTGWEEKDEAVRFDFLGATDSEIRYEALTYRHVAEDSLEITVNLRDEEGNEAPTVLRLQRVGM
jgi:hypothetical protein